MLKGFELETSPLNEYERDVLLPVMVRCLSNKIGKGNAVTNRFMVERLKKSGYDINDIRIRKIISHIRTNGLVPCLIATNTGYYVSQDKVELRDYINSLKGRERAIRAVREAVESQSGLY